MKLLKDFLACVVVGLVMVVLIPGVLWIGLLAAVFGGLALLAMWSFDRVSKLRAKTS